MSVIDSTVASRLFFSRPSSCARFGSDQTLGSSRSLLTSTRRFSFASKSKVPPQLRGPLLQVFELVGKEVEAFGFHEGWDYSGQSLRLMNRRE